MNRRHAIRQAIESLEQRVLFSTITVNTLADETIANSTTSLREAITKAASGDTIQFGVTGTIQLNPTELSINKNLTITGPGASSLTIRGMSTSRIFNIASATNEVSISGLTLAGGRANLAGGGAIYNAGQLNLTGCVFSDNTAEEDNSASPILVGGGAIRNVANSTFRASQCTFTKNQANVGYGATAGGAISSDVPVSLNGCTFSANVTNWSSYGDGGGAALYLAAPASSAGSSILNCTFNDNLAFLNGGAIYAPHQNLTIESCTFTNNTASEGAGGAIDVVGNATIRASTFKKNQAQGGGGGAIKITGNLSLLLSNFANNFCEFGAGGGLSLKSTSGLSMIDRCTFQGNNAAIEDGDGGAMAVTGGEVNVSGSTFNDNISERWGAGVYVSGANVLLYQCTINRNTGGAGSAGRPAGGLVIANGGIVTLTQSTVADNASQFGAGAGIRVESGRIDISASTISGNVISAAPGVLLDGGGIYVGPIGIASIVRSTIAQNRSSPGSGGAILDDGGSLLLNGCTVSGNSASESGGGIVTRNGAVAVIENTIIAGNDAPIAPDFEGQAHSEGFNLIGKSDGSSGWIFSDQRGTVKAPLNALLGPLANNGGLFSDLVGPPRTMSPLDSSPVIDAGKAFGQTTDERNSKRPVDFSTIPNASGGDGSDIGALERGVTPTQLQSPFATFNIGATPIKIQAEDFDYGRDGVAYHDTDPANNGGWYRTSGVDIEQTTDTGGGFDIGWTRAGEYLEYTVSVQKAGLYDFAFRVANPASGASLHMEVDGANVTGALSVPNTGGFQTWQTITKKQVQLGTGTHVLRLAFDKGASNLAAGNVNYFQISPSSTTNVTTVTSDTAAYVRDGSSASTNFGSKATLEVKKGTAGFNRETFVKFNIGSIASITSAKLRLFGSLLSTENPSMALSVADTTTTWDENTITWNNRPTGQTTVGNFTVTGTTPTWYDLDITSYLKSAKAAGKTTVSFVIRSTQTTSATCSFNSDDATTNRPQLVVTN